MNKNVKRATVVLALTPLMGLPAAAFAATTPGLHVASVATSAATTAKTATTGQASGSTTITTHSDAPQASGSAVAAQVAGVVTVGSTATTAGSGGGTAHAHALDLLGTTVAGGDVTDGSKKGSIFSTGTTPLGFLDVAPWSATITHNGGGNQSQAEAALAHAGLLDVLELWLLHSQSQSTWTPDASHGHSSSDGAEANLAGQLDVKVLHAETDSNGKGSSALLVINGTGIGTNDQLGSGCALKLDPLADILCLQAAGGNGANGTSTSSAFVADVTGALPGATITGAKSGGGHVAAGTPSTPTTTHRSTNGGPLPHTTGGPSTGRLPFTGGETGLLALYGALLTGLGAAITRVARRRPAALV